MDRPDNILAKWISPRTNEERHPILYHDFTCEKGVVRATLYISGLGLFEAYINGLKAGDELLTPFFGDYSECVELLSIDITALIERNNRIEIWLGNGWYKGRFGMVPRTNRWGDTFAAIAQIDIEYDDGTTEAVSTDGSWYSVLSPVLDSGIYDGESLDYTLAPGEPAPVKTLDWGTDVLIPRYSERLAVIQRLPVKSIIQTPEGDTVLDFGQNFAGWVEFEAELPVDSMISLGFGEILVDGNFYNENYRTATKGFSVISDGLRRQYRPRFTYFGFRYVRVSTSEPVNIEFIGCVIHSDVRRTGSFECGNADVNRLYQNALWSQRSNFVDIPTDCPQRDERLAWAGDAQVFAATACFNYDCRGFYEKYLRLLRAEQQKRGGLVSNYFPGDAILNEACSVWGDAATIVPMTLYERYAELPYERYFIMRDWVNAISDKYRNGFGFQLGDWLALDGITETSVKGGTEDALVASLFWYNSAILTAKAAKLLDNMEDYRRFSAMADEVRERIIGEYFSATGRLAVDTQTAYILCLRFGVFKDKEKLISWLRNRLKKDCYAITSGFAGAPLICSVLAENGMEDLALRLLLREEYPGWLHCVRLGATTIWERWNSLLPDGSVNPAGMNSFNHYAYGSIVQFMYENVAGLKSTAPGFKSVRFSPCIDARLGKCTASYDSISGRWESFWAIGCDGAVTVRLSVPEGCCAVVCLPRYKSDAFEIGEGVFELSYIPTRDFRLLYDEDSVLGDLAGDSRAIAILEQHIPAAAKMALHGDKEIKTTTLSELKNMPYMGIDPHKAALAVEEISELVLYIDRKAS